MSAPAALPELLKTRDVAAWLGVEPGTIHDWIESGRIPRWCYTRIPGGTPRGRLRFYRAQLETWLEQTAASVSGDQQNAPATRKRPGADTRKDPPDARRILRPIKADE